MEQLMIFNSAEVLEAILATDGAACPFLNDYWDQQDNAAGGYSDTYTFSVPANHADAAYIVKGNYAGFTDNDGDFQLFRVIKAELDQYNASLKTAYCEHSFYELRNDAFVEDVRPTDTSAGLAVTSVLSGTRWELGTADDLGNNSLVVYRKSVLAGLGMIAAKWGGELRFRLHVSGGVIDHRYVDILARRGSITGKRFETGKDIIGIRHTEDVSSLCTALYGYGKGEEIPADEPAGDPAYGRRLDFSDEVWTTAGGDPVNKPADQTWVGDDTAKALYGFAGGSRHIFDKVEFDDITDAGELLQATYNELQRRIVPAETWEMDVIQLEKITGLEHEAVRLGDTVNTINLTLDTTGTARVIQLRRSRTDPLSGRVTLGTFIPTATRRLSALQATQHSMQERQGVWDRSNAFGTAPTGGGLLQYTLDLLKIQLFATTSHFYTDADGNSIWETADGSMAVKIGGGIIAVSNSKSGGEFVWTTYATGNGFVANEVLAAVGTFLTLTAGTPGAQRRVMGSDSGNPYDEWYDSTNLLRRRGTPEGDYYFDSLGAVATLIGTTTENKQYLIGSGRDYTDPQDVIDLLPSTIFHDIELAVWAGSYGALNLPNFDGPGSITISGQEAGVNIERINTAGVGCDITLYNLTVTGTSGITLTDCEEVLCQNITMTTSTIGMFNAAIWYLGTGGRVLNCTLSNKNVGIRTDGSRVVKIQDVAGTGNTTAVDFNSVVLDCGGNTIASTNGWVSYAGSGGVLFKAAGGLTPSGLDGKYITGTPGTSGNLSKWNADGDLVDSGATLFGIGDVLTLRKRHSIYKGSGGSAWWKVCSFRATSGSASGLLEVHASSIGAGISGRGNWKLLLAGDTAGNANYTYGRVLYADRNIHNGMFDLRRSGAVYTLYFNIPQYTVFDIELMTSSSRLADVTSYDGAETPSETAVEITGSVVVDEGSNSNGTYRKFSNGTMECWHNDAIEFTTKPINTALGAGYYYNGTFYTWTYPVAFISADDLVANGFIFSNRIPAVAGGSTTTTQASFSVWAVYAITSGSGSIRLYAKGKWI